jgi:uncharacterized protein YjbJ (UPF0337 family)
MQIGTVDLDKLRGVSDKFIGLAKEATGVLIDNDSLQKAGEAQQDRASENLKALRKEADAEKEQKKADSIARTQDNDSGGGVLAQAKGKAKEVTGNTIGDSRLRDDGVADQKRGAAERNATKDKAAAKTHNARAKADEKAQESAERNA